MTEAECLVRACRRLARWWGIRRGARDGDLAAGELEVYLRLCADVARNLVSIYGRDGVRRLAESARRRGIQRARLRSCHSDSPEKGSQSSQDAPGAPRPGS